MPPERPYHVLVVDDEPSNREVAERALTHRGYHVVSCATSSHAMAHLEEHGFFDAYVIDVVLPGIRGQELANLIRRRDSNAKILYFTGYPEALFWERKVLPAGEAVVQKPASIAALLEAISLLIFGHLAGPERRRVAR